jgi:hypothetical protein
MSNTNDTILAVNNLDDEFSATCNGGRVVVGGINPNITLFDQVPPRRGASLKISATIGAGISDLTRFNFDNITSFVDIRRGSWALFKDSNYKGAKLVLNPGRYSLSGFRHFFFGFNNQISSLKRVS